MEASLSSPSYEGGKERECDCTERRQDGKDLRVSKEVEKEWRRRHIHVDKAAPSEVQRGLQSSVPFILFWLLLYKPLSDRPLSFYKHSFPTFHSLPRG